MTQEDKDLILKDLCARLPYGVKAYIKVWVKFRGKWIEGIYTVRSIDPSVNDVYASTEDGIVGAILGNSDYSIKPYLYPLSSMTEEQKLYLEWHTKYRLDDGELVVKRDEDDEYLNTNIYDYLSLIEWLNKNHFDYQGLIERGLAIDATGLDIY